MFNQPSLPQKIVKVTSIEEVIDMIKSFQILRKKSLSFSFKDGGKFNVELSPCGSYLINKTTGEPVTEQNFVPVYANQSLSTNFQVSWN